MGVDDAEVVVLLASVTHDLGMSVIRDGHEVFNVAHASAHEGVGREPTLHQENLNPKKP